MPSVKQPPRPKPPIARGRGRKVGVKTGGVRPRVAPATPNCGCQPERRPQSRAAQPARVSARTLDGAPPQRLSSPDTKLTSNTVASTRRRIRSGGSG
jgi:hypothetical protein